MGEIGSFYSGLTGKSKNDFSDGNAKFITFTNIFSNIAVKLDTDATVKISQNEKQNTVMRGDVLFTGSSEIKEESGMSSVVTMTPVEPTYLNSFSFGFRIKNEFKDDLNPEFMKFLFRSKGMRKSIIKTANGVTRFNVSKKRMLDVKVPIIPLVEQNRIVVTLDKFEKLTSDISVGLPAEIEARRKQYEYYRNKLLTFKELERSK
jgi:anti-codon nuclease masking agent (prrB)